MEECSTGTAEVFGTRGTFFIIIACLSSPYNLILSKYPSLILQSVCNAMNASLSFVFRCVLQKSELSIKLLLKLTSMYHEEVKPDAFSHRKGVL